MLQHAAFSHSASSLPKISPCSPGSRWMAFGLRTAKVLGYLSVQLVFKISNLCGPDPPTSRRDRQTDDMQSQYRALHYSASRGKNDALKSGKPHYLLKVARKVPVEYGGKTKHIKSTIYLMTISTYTLIVNRATACTSNYLRENKNTLDITKYQLLTRYPI